MTNSFSLQGMSSAGEPKGISERKKTSLSVDPDLWAEVRIKALREKRDVGDVIDQVFRRWLAGEAQAGQSSIEAIIDREDMDRLKERAAARGFDSVHHLAAYLLEREAAGEAIDMSALSPDEAEVARAVVEIYRNPDPKHPVAPLFAGFFVFLKNQVAQRKLVNPSPTIPDAPHG